MPSRTVAPPPTDRSMWRRLLARTHPDAGGDGDLFVWTRELQEKVCGRQEEEEPGSRRRDPPPPAEPTRVPFDEAPGFEALTEKAVEMADEVEPVYARLLRLLGSCEEVEEGYLLDQQHQGATYRTLAAIGHAAGMSGAERADWYRIAESIPLSQRHAGHILGKLKEKTP